MNSSWAYGVSADGSVVVGYAYSTGTSNVAHAYRWSVSGGMQDLGAGASGINAVAYGVSDDGGTIVGDTYTSSNTYHAFRWTSGTGIQDLGTFGGTNSEAAAVSGDGQVIVGFAQVAGTGVARPFRWTNAEGMQEIRSLGSSATGAYASAVNHDGSVIVGRSALNGSAYEHAFKWTAPDSAQDLDTLLGPQSLGYSHAFGVSGDGSVAVGESFPSLSAAIGAVGPAIRWTTSSESLGTLPTSCGQYYQARAASADGSVIVGTMVLAPYLYPTCRPFFWTRATGMQDLTNYLLAHGVDLTGWSLRSAFAVSADGTTIVGTGAHGNYYGGWRVVLDLDTDGDGIPDDWEISGIPYTYADATGQHDGHYRLQDLDPVHPPDRFHKDLYVEVDVMAGVPFSETSLAAVRAAFAAAPVSNPDGQDGITLHTVIDERNVPIGTGSFPESQIPVYHQSYFGTPDERTPSNASKLAAKAKAFRHCLFVNSVSSTTPGTILGEATGIPGTAFVVALGGVPWEADKIERHLGQTFMHELGHTLGLCHGGTDSTLYKPNYISVMNYNYDELYRRTGNTQQRLALDYSREVMDTLRETCLDERASVGPVVGPSWSTGVIVPFAYADAQAPGGRSIGHLTIGVPPVDWNVDGSIDPCVSDDINWFPPNNPIDFLSAASSGDTMGGFNDWPAIVYRVPPESPVQLRCPGASRVCSLTAELVDWNSRNLPPPPLCVADFDNGTGTGTPDGGVTIDDLLYYLTIYAAGVTRADIDNGTGTGTPDGGVTIDDLLFFLAHYAAGC